MSLLALCAKPGDPDLDCDVDGLSIESVVALGGEVIVTFGGEGWGCWPGFTAEPGDESSRVVRAEIRAEFGPRADGTPADGYVERLAAHLDVWKARAVPLRVCCAPGRFTTLIADRTDWLAFPRT